MKIAFNEIDEAEYKNYIGKVCQFTSRDNNFHKGLCTGIDDNGIQIEWSTEDPTGFCIGKQVYSNVKGSIELLEWL